MAVATSPAPEPAPPAIATPAYRWSVGLALAALQSLVYFGIGHLHLSRSTEILRTRLDDAIPFWPWTSWCYLPFYAGVFIIAIAALRRYLGGVPGIGPAHRSAGERVPVAARRAHDDARAAAARGSAAAGPG